MSELPTEKFSAINHRSGETDKGNKIKKKFGVITVILIILLSIRLISQFAVGFLALNRIEFIIFFLFGIMYLVALIGLFKKQKWGSVLVMILAVIDILAALTLGGAKGFGAGIADLMLLFLGYKEYQHVFSSQRVKNGLT